MDQKYPNNQLLQLYLRNAHHNIGFNKNQFFCHDAYRLIALIISLSLIFRSGNPLATSTQLPLELLSGVQKNITLSAQSKLTQGRYSVFQYYASHQIHWYMIMYRWFYQGVGFALFPCE